MSPFWTLFYTPAIAATLPTRLMIATWANYAELMNSPVARRQTEIPRGVTPQSSSKNVIPIRSTVARSTYAAKKASTDSKRPDNVVSLEDKRRRRKA